MASNTAESWVAVSAEVLREHGSWTGRIHIHKHLYLAKELGLAQPPFDFVLYQYGPYSYDLDSEIAQMELYGFLQKSFPQPGYGPQYAVSEIGQEEAAALDPGAADALRRLAEKIGHCDSQELELQATCLWVARQEKVMGDGSIIGRVRQLKPKYGEVQIGEALAAVRQLESSLRKQKAASA